jgi:hypothetical protein
VSDQQRDERILRDDERSLLRALKEMTAGPTAERSPLAKIASRLKKAFTPNRPFDAKAWAESVVKVRPGNFGRGGDVVIGDTVEEHWTSMSEAKASGARIRAALIASLPEHLGAK